MKLSCLALSSQKAGSAYVSISTIENVEFTNSSNTNVLPRFIVGYQIPTNSSHFEFKFGVGLRIDDYSESCLIQKSLSGRPIGPGFSQSTSNCEFRGTDITTTLFLPLNIAYNFNKKSESGFYVAIQNNFYFLRRTHLEFTPLLINGEVMSFSNTDFISDIFSPELQVGFKFKTSKLSFEPHIYYGKKNLTTPIRSTGLALSVLFL